MSAPAEATSGKPATTTGPRRPPRPGRQALVGLGAIAVVLLVISAISILSSSRQGLRASVIGPRRVAPGDPVRWKVSVRDTAGSTTDLYFDFGDDQSSEPFRGRPPARCDPERSATSELVELDHVYPRPGVYTARVRVISGGCGARVERAEGERTITVKAIPR